MLWTILSILGILLGGDLIIRGADTLIEWRAWFLSLLGLAILVPSLLRVILQIRKLRKKDESGMEAV